MKAIDYTKKSLTVEASELKKIHEVVDSVFYRTVSLTWVTIFLIIYASVFISERFEQWYFLYPIIAFVIASRMGVLLQLVHEAAHGLLVNNRKLNNLLCDLFCAMPIGITNDGYARGHAYHHAHTGTEKDPQSDREKYKEPNLTKLAPYILLLKDIFGITALSVFRSYFDNNKEIIEKKEKATVLSEKLLVLIRFGLVQICVFGILFRFDIKDYLIFWLYPAMGPHMVLMRFRGIAEHGLAGQLNRVVDNVRSGIFHTRSFGTPVNQYKNKIFSFTERFLIGSLNVYYHHEHHLYPSVPFYKLPELHALVSEQIIESNPDVYAKGYFSAAFRNVTGSQ